MSERNIHIMLRVTSEEALALDRAASRLGEPWTRASVAREAIRRGLSTLAPTATESSSAGHVDAGNANGEESDDRDRCLHCDRPLTTNHPTAYCGLACEGAYHAAR